MIKQIPNKPENIVDEGVDRLTSFFKCSETGGKGVLKPLLQQIQDYVDLTYPILTSRFLPTAIGDQLDRIGDFVGEPRRGRNNVEYRRWIYARILINNAKGTTPEVIEIFKIITGATQVQVQDWYPLEVFISSNAILSINDEEYDSEAFAFDGGVDGAGFGDVFDSEVGGRFAGYVETDLTWLYQIIDSVLAASVKLFGIGEYSDNAFAFDGGEDGGGFGDVFDSTTGGEFGSIIYVG